MSKVIKSSEKFINEAAIHGKVQHRSAPKKIVYCARISKIYDVNTGFFLGFIKGVLTCTQ